MSDSGSTSPLLVLGGEPPTHELIAYLHAHRSPIVAADAGALTLGRMGFLPDIVIGDFDSAIDAVTGLRHLHVRVVIEPQQETTDFEKGLAWIHGQGHSRVTLVGVGGRMFDHALNNISIVARWSALLRIMIIERESMTQVLSGKSAVISEPGERISLIPAPRAVVTTRGLQWELRRTELATGIREGASNRARTTRIEVDVEEGILLLFRYPRGGVLEALKR